MTSAGDPDLAGRYTSWGRYPRAAPARVSVPAWPTDSLELQQSDLHALPYGRGRSYGDSCLNDGGLVVDTHRLDRFIRFDREGGTLRCEAGVTLASVVDLVLPHGWFLPVTPGTKFVSIGGAIAHDVHGKNHHRRGTFGRHVRSFELLRSDGSRLVCSPERNVDLFRATIGGMGLTGLITWAELDLRRVDGPFLDVERRRFGGLEEFFALAVSSDIDFEYTVAWVDCVARGSKLGRGIFIRGNHSERPGNGSECRVPKPRHRIRFEFPNRLLNPWSVRLFNTAYFRGHRDRAGPRVEHFDPFFYPLDGVSDWNRIYGRRGFLQYQCVVPTTTGRNAIQRILELVVRHGTGSFLAVLKVFGDQPSPGLMSFPMPGVTLALDFPVDGGDTMALLSRCDEIVAETGGAVYAAKDARMSGEHFDRFYPQWRRFAEYVDPRMSSDFWRRVTASEVSTS